MCWDSFVWFSGCLVAWLPLPKSNRKAKYVEKKLTFEPRWDRENQSGGYPGGSPPECGVSWGIAYKCFTSEFH